MTNFKAIRNDIRILIGSGVILAVIGVFSSPTDKAFTLLSTTSSTLIGAGVGILRERSEVDEENSRHLKEIVDNVRHNGDREVY